MTEVQLEDGPFGPVATVRGPCDDEALALLVRNRVAGLVLNTSFGWQGESIEFVRKLEWLKTLWLTNRALPDDAALNALHDLRRLSLTTNCEGELDFANFPKLEKCSFRWRRRVTNLFGCTSLKMLYFAGYKGHSSEPFGRLVNLEDLTVVVSPITSLAGLAGLTKLRKLWLAGLRKLENLDGLEHLVGLEFLVIDGCGRITSLERLRSLVNLKRLIIDNCGEIDSLAPIADLKNLEVLGFPGTTNVLDGDLRPILALPKLVSGDGFQRRKHYNLRWPDVPHWASYEEGEAYNDAHPI